MAHPLRMPETERAAWRAILEDARALQQAGSTPRPPILRGAPGGLKGGDVDRAAAVVALLSARLQCRTWFDYVKSKANRSDGLSQTLTWSPG